MSKKRHDHDSKDFRELTRAQQAHSINAQVTNLGRSIKMFAEGGDASAQIAQVGKLLARLLA